MRFRRGCRHELDAGCAEAEAVEKRAACRVAWYGCCSVRSSGLSALVSRGRGVHQPFGHRPGLSAVRGAGARVKGGAGQVPTANRGLKVSGRQIAAEAAEQKTALGIDFLTVTADAICTIRNTAQTPHVLAVLESIIATGQNLETLALYLFDYFFEGVTGITCETELRGFRNFYTHHVRLIGDGGAQVGFIALGGERQRGTYCIEVTGAGCAHVKAWDSLKRKLESAGGRITRVDVAHDDFDGVHDLALCRALHAAGEFTTNGRPPAFGEQGFDDDSGRTVYVGKNIGNQQLCVYEKGKQLGDKNSRWVRWEARFGCKYRDIPLDVLTAPAEFMRGHFPALHFVEAIGRRMATHVKRAASSMVKAMHWCRHQYGGLLNLLSVQIRDRRDFAAVVETLSRPKLPKWASEIPHAAQSRAAAVHLLLPAGVN